MKSKEDIIEYRLGRSDETIKEALLLRSNGHFNSTVNRLYYAAFYAASAVLYKQDIYSKTHSGLKSLFHEHLIKTQKISNENGKVYQQLFEYRQDGDYGDFIIFDKEEVNALFERTQLLINEIKKLIK